MDFGVDSQDGLERLTNLRFAGDLLLFACSRDEIGVMLDLLVVALSRVGLLLNSSKTKVLTTMAQPPSTITTPGGLELTVIARESAHRWLGCMLSAGGPETRHLDINFHLQAAAKAFHANKMALCDKHASMIQRLT